MNYEIPQIFVIVIFKGICPLKIIVGKMARFFRYDDFAIHIKPIYTIVKLLFYIFS